MVGGMGRKYGRMSLGTPLGGAKGGGLSGPALNLDLTTSLPPSITFTRTGARNAIVNGALVSVASGQPAFESWDGVARGMAVDAAPSGGNITQLLTYSNDFSNAVQWGTSSVTRATGDAGPDGVAGSLTALAETTASAIHGPTYFATPTSIAAGTRQTFYTIVKPLGTATRWALSFRVSDQNDNAGPIGIFMIDGTPGSYVVADTTKATNVVQGLRKLANGMFLLSMTVTWVNTANKVAKVATCNQDGSPSGAVYAAFVGATTEGFQCYGLQCITGAAPTGWVTTTSAALTQPAEIALFNDLSWFTSAKGTFIVEHDCAEGVLIGSAATAIMNAPAAGKTALAWDGSGSDLVSNGGGGHVRRYAIIRC